jgi:flagellin-like hook-associated protein FlgL
MSTLGIGDGNTLQIAAALPHIQNTLSREMKELSTGLRVSSPVDDPAAYSEGVNVQTLISSRDAATQQLESFNNTINITTQNIQSAIGIVQRIRTLAQAASSSLLSPSDLKSIQLEIDQLTHELSSLSETTNGDGVPLFYSVPVDQPAIVQTQTTTAPDSGNPTAHLYFTLASAPAAGNVLVVAIGNGNGPGGGPAATVVTPPGWTLQTSATNSNDNSLQLYTHVVAAGDPTAYTFSMTPGDLEAGTIVELSGINASTPFQTVGIQQTNPPASVSTPAITTTSENELALAFHEINGAANPGGSVSGAGWTEIGSVYQIWHPFEAQVSSANAAIGQILQSSYTFGPGSVGPGESAIIVMNPPPHLTSSIQVPVDGQAGNFTSVTRIAIDPRSLGLEYLDVTKTTTNAIQDCDNALSILTTGMTHYGATSICNTASEQNNAVQSVAEQNTFSAFVDLNVPSAVANYQLTKTNLNLVTRLQQNASSSAQQLLKLFQAPAPTGNNFAALA